MNSIQYSSDGSNWSNAASGGMSSAFSIAFTGGGVLSNITSTITTSTIFNNVSSISTVLLSTVTTILPALITTPGIRTSNIQLNTLSSISISELFTMFSQWKANGNKFSNT